MCRAAAGATGSRFMPSMQSAATSGPVSRSVVIRSGADLPRLFLCAAPTNRHIGHALTSEASVDPSDQRWVPLSCRPRTPSTTRRSETILTALSDSP